MNAIGFLLWVLPILFALTIHEYSHGWVAYKLKDPTAKLAGRLTLNPIKHLDPIGTIALFLFHFGWAKPVPVNPYNFTNPRKDMLWVGLAGPGANILGALGFGIVYRIFNLIPVEEIRFLQPIYIMVIYSVLINLILAFFNFIPIPPLDGSKILKGILPANYASWYSMIESFGSFLLIGLIFVSIMIESVTGISLIWGVISPFIRFFSWVFTGKDLLHLI